MSKYPIITVSLHAVSHLYPVPPDDLGVPELAVGVVDAHADHVLLHAAGRRVGRPPVSVDRVLGGIDIFGLCMTFLPIPTIFFVLLLHWTSD